MQLDTKFRNIRKRVEVILNRDMDKERETTGEKEEETVSENKITSLVEDEEAGVVVAQTASKVAKIVPNDNERNKRARKATGKRKED